MSRAKLLELVCGNCNKPIYKHSGVEAQDCLIIYNTKLKEMQDKQTKLELRIKKLEKLFLEKK